MELAYESQVVGVLALFYLGVVWTCSSSMVAGSATACSHTHLLPLHSSLFRAEASSTRERHLPARHSKPEVGFEPPGGGATEKDFHAHALQDFNCPALLHA